MGEAICSALLELSFAIYRHSTCHNFATLALEQLRVISVDVHKVLSVHEVWKRIVKIRQNSVSSNLVFIQHQVFKLHSFLDNKCS